MSAVRTARRDSAERIVFEFRGAALPGYRVAYTSEVPSDCGSGERVAIEGAVFLEVAFAPADAHEFDGESARSTIPSRRLRPNYAATRELRLTCDFEANVAWAIGLDSRRRYHILALASPPRLVIDIVTR